MLRGDFEIRKRMSDLPPKGFTFFCLLAVFFFPSPLLGCLSEEKGRVMVSGEGRRRQSAGFTQDHFFKKNRNLNISKTFVVQCHAE